MSNISLINCNIYLSYKETCFLMFSSPGVSPQTHIHPMMLRGCSHGLCELIPYTKRNRREIERDLYQLCRHVINRSVITTCRLLRTYECITLPLLNFPETYFSTTNTPATLNSCHFFLLFYSNIDNNTQLSTNICSFQPSSGIHITHKTHSEHK